MKRFKQKYKVDTETGCWNWTAYRDRQGYGRFSLEGQIVRSHRVSWILHYGPVPDGMHVLHRCDNTSCCNWGHLFLGTHSDNMKDKEQKGRGLKGRTYSKEHRKKMSDSHKGLIPWNKGLTYRLKNHQN